jgi:DNA polymerase-1
MQIPSAKDQYGLKKLFVAPKGQLLICLDYSQLEIRMMCVFCKDPAMTEIMRDPHGDIHTNTAKEFNVPRSPVAKFINFNLQYGGGGWMMSQILTVAGVPTTQEEGEKYRQMYDNTYPGVHLFRQKMYDFHRCEGYFPYIHGMRRVVPDLNSKNARMVHGAENQLVNNIIQGSGQVLVKQSVLRADYMQPNWDAKYLKVLSAKSGNSRHKAIIAEYAKQVEIYRKLFEAAHCRFLMQVHDELLFCVDAEAAVEAGNALADLMTWIPWFVPVTPFHIPLKVDGGIGKSWKEAKGDSAIAKIEFFGKRYD